MHSSLILTCQAGDAAVDFFPAYSYLSSVVVACEEG